MPRPDEGDLFFDMEGDPLEEGGLEYLFGLYLLADGEPQFRAFWAYDRAGEKLAFEQFMDFVTAWLRDHPGAHIYHYAAYEQTALKRLMSLHGTREAEVDNLLRTHKLVDLYKVVREGIRVSEPRYSIKNIEHFYLDGRTGDVTNAGASIVWFERWKETGDEKYLKDIEAYNYDDVRSTFELRQWLLSLRPVDTPWFSAAGLEGSDAPAPGGLSPAEQRLVGISSNSHKAINNLLSGVERVARESGLVFRGAKKSTAKSAESMLSGELVEDVFENEDITGELEGPHPYQLVAGTAWLFADPALDRKLDYLFVDEAGQVAVANLVAMGTSARNIVLLGDQMQLGQPIQGVHPGRSGESALEYLLDGIATIPPDRGIFLAQTWRMHPDICRFISDAVYDGRLESEPGTHNQSLLLDSKAHPALKPTGIVFLPAEHEGCGQRSEVEADMVTALFESLLTQRYRDRRGVEHALTSEDILIVAPYNMQVNLLRETLPEGARVGTVDKFQGQEAEVVIVSMATSSGDDLPRDIGFLYSRNRLNVAISRARCLAVVVANPALTAVRCKTPEDMALVNTLCWVREVGVLSRN